MKILGLVVRKKMAGLAVVCSGQIFLYKTIDTLSLIPTVLRIAEAYEVEEAVMEEVSGPGQALLDLIEKLLRERGVYTRRVLREEGGVREALCDESLSKIVGGAKEQLGESAWAALRLALFSFPSVPRERAIYADEKRTQGGVPLGIGIKD